VTAAVCIASEGMCGEGTRKLRKDMPNSQLACLVEVIRNRVFGEIRGRLMWWTESITQWWKDHKLRAKCKMEAAF